MAKFTVRVREIIRISVTHENLVSISLPKIQCKQERKTFIRSKAITMSCMIVIPENHSTRDENDYVIS